MAQYAVRISKCGGDRPAIAFAEPTRENTLEKYIRTIGFDH